MYVFVSCQGTATVNLNNYCVIICWGVSLLAVGGGDCLHVGYHQNKVLVRRVCYLRPIRSSK